MCYTAFAKNSFSCDVVQSRDFERRFGTEIDKATLIGDVCHVVSAMPSRFDSGKTRSFCNVLRILEVAHKIYTHAFVVKKGIHLVVMLPDTHNIPATGQ